MNKNQVLATAAFLKKHIIKKPIVGLLTGTGFSQLPDGLEIICEFDYSRLPEFPLSTVESHKGRVIHAKINNNHVLIFQGRFHLYEGYSPAQCSCPVRVMQELGVKKLILTNAAGGINLDFSPGQIMIIKDHINLTGQNPLAGPNEETWGIRFPDMTQVYDPGLIKMVKEIAGSNKIPVKTGIYAGLQGPSLETPAEIRFLKTIGSDAVGLSTVMEAIAGVHAGMKILGLSLITNTNDPDNPAGTTLEEVLEIAARSIKPMNSILSELLGNSMI